MKVRNISVACGAVLFGVSSMAQAEFSANIGATSNYVWRGVTQTDDQAAVQGGLDYEHESGLYVGTWVSNVDFGDGGETEWDIYAGYANEFEGFSYDLGYIQYYYPNTSDTDFGEIGLNLGYGPFSAGVQYTVYSDINKDKYGQAFVNGDIYAYASANIDLPMGFTGGVTVGHYWWDEDGDKQESGGNWDANYTYVQLDIGKSAGDFGDFTFSVSKAETSDVTDNKVIPFVSWTKTF